ncbi:hypothetical protein [Pedobacter nutrimenti]|jgi:hypothetical protein|uniref:Outer membrane protein with beta-barrel domain n=1 Tax=Pedobacter nutrimenti TaxID=1241337 RepID=A0A318UEM7_9SPHI|nr:hypothetical protein [Pedobacter nutrimenti]PYF72577.1 hypothetical protein B0O44_106232 [Pedobacter nutrimenti]
MKNFTLGLLIVLLGVGLTANAQIQKGNVLIGGDLADMNLGLNGAKVFSFEITPKAAWFIQDNVALGGYAKLGISTAKGAATTTTYGIGALGRYYTGKDVEVLKHGRFFGEATFGFGGSNTSQGGSNTNGIDFGVGPGFAYFITPNIGLETLLKYQGLTGFGNNGYQHSLHLSFGFQIYLPGQHTANKVKSDIR